MYNFTDEKQTFALKMQPENKYVIKMEITDALF